MLASHNQKGAATDWKIGLGAFKPLRDIATLIIEADTITIHGIAQNSIELNNARQLEGFVFAGPDYRMGNEGDPHEYDRINHALLLGTIYTIPEGKTSDQSRKRRSKINSGEHWNTPVIWASKSSERWLRPTRSTA